MSRTIFFCDDVHSDIVRELLTTNLYELENDLTSAQVVIVLYCDDMAQMNTIRYVKDNGFRGQVISRTLLYKVNLHEAYQMYPSIVFTSYKAVDASTMAVISDARIRDVVSHVSIDISGDVLHADGELHQGLTMVRTLFGPDTFSKCHVSVYRTANSSAHAMITHPIGITASIYVSTSRNEKAYRESIRINGPIGKTASLDMPYGDFSMAERYGAAIQYFFKRVGTLITADSQREAMTSVAL